MATAGLGVVLCCHAEGSFIGPLKSGSCHTTELIHTLPPMYTEIVDSTSVFEGERGYPAAEHRDVSGGCPVPCLSSKPPTVPVRYGTGTSTLLKSNTI